MSNSDDGQKEPVENDFEPVSRSGLKTSPANARKTYLT